MTGRLALVALTMSVVAVSAGPARTQTTAVAKHGQIWLDAVRNHRPGELDNGVRAVAQWSRADRLESAKDNEACGQRRSRPVLSQHRGDGTRPHR